MTTLLSIAAIGNLIDTIATLILYGYGYTEANPIMDLLLSVPAIFATVKITAMTAVLVWLWMGRNSKYAQYAAWFAAVVFGALSVYYGVFFLLL